MPDRVITVEKRAGQIMEGDHVVERDGALLKVTMVRVHKGFVYLWLESGGVGPRSVTWYGRASKVLRVLGAVKIVDGQT